MRNFILAAAAAALLAAGGPAMAQQRLNTTPLPISAIEKHPAVQGIQLSPDGKRIAGLIGRDDQKWPVVAIWDAEDLSKAPTLMASNRMRPVGLFFASNEKVMFFADQPFTQGAFKSFTRVPWVTDTTAKPPRDPVFGSANRPESFSVLAGGNGNLKNPNRWIMTKFNEQTNSSEVLAYDAATGETQSLLRVPEDQSFLLADQRDGEIMVKQELKFTNGLWMLNRFVRNRANGQWDAHPELDFMFKSRVAMDPVCFCDENPDHLYVNTNKGAENTQIRIYNVRTKQWDPEPAFAIAGWDAAGVIGGADISLGKMVGATGFTYAGPSIEQVFMDDVWAPVHQMLKRQFPGALVSIGSANTKSMRAVVTVEQFNRPPEYFLYSTFNGKPKLSLIGKERPWIENATLGTSAWVNYAARDGLNIPGILTLPPGYKKETHGRIPTIILPHGGPWARDFMGWDSSGWPQFLATRGYAVLQPQYRGSDGLGMKLWKAGDGEWGQKMQDDKDDGGNWLVNQGIADPNKMAMFGYSYGGFAAVAAAVRPRSPYRCAIAGAPAIDLQKIKLEWGANRIQRQLQGDTVAGMDPMQNIDKANIPLLIYHGDRDRQADTWHSTTFYSRAANKMDVRYVEIKDMWHQLPWWPEWHRQSLSLIEEYLAGPKCFGNNGQSAAASAGKGG
ncbi:MAG: alpha/beta hydrolase family protein [Caulobacterales bacterium]